MPGVNLSQSTEGGSVYQAKSGSEKGRLVVFLVFFMTLVFWGGARVASSVYDKKNATRQQQIQEKKVSFADSTVNNIADVDARLSLITQKKEGQVYPNDILAAIEGGILPTNYLVLFHYDFQTNVITIEGGAPGYKELSQQLMAYKTSPRFSNVFISSVSKDKGKTTDIASNAVEFEITLNWIAQ